MPDRNRSRLVALFVALLAVSALVLACPTAALAAAKPKLSAASGKVVIGATKTIKVKNASGARITYASKNKKVATVTKKGVVKGIKAGTTKIQVKVKKGSKTTKLTYKVTVKKPTISQTKASLAADATLSLSVKNKPAKGTKASYTWSSSDKTVASVASGKVRAVAPGKATITCKVKALKTTYTLTCTVTVTSPTPEPKPDPEQPATFTVRFSTGDGTPVQSQVVAAGAHAARPVDPELADHAFAGWSDDAGQSELFDFETPITEDTTLYACWQRVVPTTLVLYTDSQDLLVEDGTSAIAFAATTDAEAGTMLLFDADTGAELGTFASPDPTGSDDGTDDAAATQGPVDASASGSFTTCTCLLDAYPAHEGMTARFVAECGGIRSNTVEVAFYEPFTDEQLDRMQAVDDRVEELLSADGFYELSDEERRGQAEALLGELCGVAAGSGASADVDADNQLILPETVCQSPDGMVYTFASADGSLSCIDVSESDPDVAGSTSLQAAVSDASPATDPELHAAGIASSTSSSTSGEVIGKGLILNAFAQEPNPIPSVIDRFHDNERSLNSQGLSTTLDEEVTIDDLKRLDGYDVILIASHGNVYHWSDRIAPLVAPFGSTCTGFAVYEKANSANNRKYSAELKSGQVFKYNGHYVVTSKFFESNYAEGELDGAFVIFESCCTAGTTEKEDLSLSDAMISRGAASVISYTNSVKRFYCHNVNLASIEGLLSGKTFWASYYDALGLYGTNDASTSDSADWSKVATPHFEGSTTARLIRLGVSNGTFERAYSRGLLGLFGSSAASTSILDWARTGTARSSTGLGTLLPRDGSGRRMALLYTGSGLGSQEVSYGGAERGSSIDQMLVVPWNATSLEFDYALVSNEPLLGSTAQDATCYVTLHAYGELEAALPFASVSSASWAGSTPLRFSLTDLPGSTSPFNKAYSTGWQHVSINLNDFVDPLGYESSTDFDYGNRRVRLRFAVCGPATTKATTICALDNVQIATYNDEESSQG